MIEPLQEYESSFVPGKSGEFVTLKTGIALYNKLNEEIERGNKLEKEVNALRYELEDHRNAINAIEIERMRLEAEVRLLTGKVALLHKEIEAIRTADIRRNMKDHPQACEHEELSKSQAQKVIDKGKKKLAKKAAA